MSNPLINSNWKHVTNLIELNEEEEEEEEWEEDEVSYLTLDFGTSLKPETWNFAANELQLLGENSSTPLARVRTQFFQGVHEESIGSEIIFRSTPDTEPPFTILPITSTSRIIFQPVSIKKKASPPPSPSPSSPGNNSKGKEKSTNGDDLMEGGEGGEGGGEDRSATEGGEEGGSTTREKVKAKRSRKPRALPLKPTSTNSVQSTPFANRPIVKKSTTRNRRAREMDKITLESLLGFDSAGSSAEGTGTEGEGEGEREGEGEGEEGEGEKEGEAERQEPEEEEIEVGVEAEEEVELEEVEESSNSTSSKKKKKPTTTTSSRKKK